jgi:DNA (cytosine-5)-methyltransferase 1
VRELALFAGAGGGILGGKLLGWCTVCAVEIDAFARSVLLARQRDGCLERFPIWDDVTTFDGTRWRGYVDVVSGGFPCQDISAAGKGEGIEGKQSGLWTEMARIVGEVQPKFVLVENSPLLVVRGLYRVLGDLATLGYDARWGVISAENAGAPHKRERCWILAYGNKSRQLVQSGKCSLGRRCSIRRWNKEEHRFESVLEAPWPPGPSRVSEVPRMVDGVGDGVDDRFAAIGNGQVPAVVRLAWEILSEGLTE